MSEAAVWERVCASMPLCDCGTRLQPGAAGEQHVLVCVGCSSVTAVSPEWVDRAVAAAREGR